MVKRLTQEEAVRNMSEDGIYDYSKFVYSGNTSKSEIICKKHGSFYKSYEQHKIDKQICPECMIDKRYEKVLDTANKKHNFKFNYSKFKYVDAKTESEIVCPEHGSFIISLQEHNRLKFGGCKGCEKQGSPYDKDSLINALIEIYGEGVFGFDDIEFVNLGTHVTLKCLECNQKFPVTPQQLLREHTGCPHCYKKNRTYTTEEIVEEFRKARGEDNFGYQFVNYQGAREKVKILCKKHNKTFEVFPSQYLYDNSNCYDCWIDSISGENSRFWNPDREGVALRKIIAGKINSLTQMMLYRDDHLEDILGYTRDELTNHITNHPNWPRCKDNDWQLDHIFPKYAFSIQGISNPKIISRLDNLQPLTRLENLLKSDKYDIEEFVIWLKQFSEEEIKLTYEEIVANHKNNLLGVRKKTNIPVTSKFIGVNKTTNGKFICRITDMFSERINLGVFDIEEDAAKCYDFNCLIYYGKQPNFPDFDYSNYKPNKNIVEKTSKLVGVTKIKDDIFLCGIKIMGKRIYLGNFCSEEEAGKNYDFYCLKYQGKQPNFPEYDYSSFVPKKVV